MTPVYIVMLHNLVTGMSYVHFASSNKEDAIVWLKKQDHKKFKNITWTIVEWEGENCKILKIDKL